MNSTVRAMTACFVAIVGAMLAATASADVTVTAHNIMVDPVTIYVRSTSLGRRATTQHNFRAEQIKAITLKGNDPFLITGIDTNRNRFDSAPVNIQANLLSNPTYVLEIGGVFAARQICGRYWSRRCRRWIYYNRTITERGEITLRLTDPTGNLPPIDLGSAYRRR